MSFNFFNQSIVKPRIVPSELEKQFLSARTGFLDPSNSKRIHGKQAIVILNHSQLSKEKIMQIWKIANQKNNEFLSYQDMYVAFRLIAYAQNGIQISKESVQSNIKCPLPVFADSDDEDDQGDKSIPNIPPPVRATSITNKYFSTNQIANFEQIWNGTSKNEYTISGNSVKKKFQSQAQKTQLSKVWKLCCRTLKGSLTKGQFFAFCQILRMTSEGFPVPDSLTPQMLASIAQIDTPIKINPNLLPKSVLVQKSNSSSRFSKIQVKLRQSEEPLKHIKAQLSSIQNQQTKFNEALKDFEGYVSVCEKNTSLLSNEIERIKTVQADSINRLNMDLSRLKQVIEKQNTIIYELTANLKNQTGDPISLPVKKQLGPPLENDAPSRFSTKSLQSQGSSKNDLYPYQLLTLKILHAVMPMTPEQLPEMQKKIVAMSLNQLKAFYQQLMIKYNEQQSMIENQNENMHEPQSHPPNITITQPERDNNVSHQTYHVKDESMFVRKDPEAMQAIQNIFGNLDLNQSNAQHRPNQENFFD